MFNILESESFFLDVERIRADQIRVAWPMIEQWNQQNLIIQLLDTDGYLCFSREFVNIHLFPLWIPWIIDWIAHLNKWEWKLEQELSLPFLPLMELTIHFRAHLLHWQSGQTQESYWEIRDQRNATNNIHLFRIVYESLKWTSMWLLDLQIGQWSLQRRISWPLHILHEEE